MNKLGSLVLAVSLVAAPVSVMAQYQGGDVKDGGSISGTVKFKGTAPAPKKLDVGKDKEVCDKSPKMDQSLIVKDGNLANAISFPFLNDPLQIVGVVAVGVAARAEFLYRRSNEQ